MARLWPQSAPHNNCWACQSRYIRGCDGILNCYHYGCPVFWSPSGVHCLVKGTAYNRWEACIDLRRFAKARALAREIAYLPWSAGKERGNAPAQ